MKHFATIANSAALMFAVVLPATAQKPGAGQSSSIGSPGIPPTALAQPTDSALVVNVRNALTREFHRGVVVITVTSSAAVVTLKGQVGDQATKLKAGQIAQGVLGVKSLVNLLTVPYRTEPANSGFNQDDLDKLGNALGGGSGSGNGQSITPGQSSPVQSNPSSGTMPLISMADVSLAAAVVKALQQQMGQGANPIHVASKQAVITLTGNVNGAGPKAQAEQIAKSVAGVKGVINLLQSRGPTITPGRSQ